jgi:Fic family protein
MQVVSGTLGKERVHFQAPDAKRLKKEMNVFLKWFNTKDDLDPVLKAGLAHFWFVTLHPFEDGNGRIARALADMQLARADGSNQRFYSMSAQILTWRKFYYEKLESTQKGTLDVSEWMMWFLECLLSALYATDVLLEKVLFKAKFWEKYNSSVLNPRQKKMLNKLLDGFDGKLSSSKWAKLCKCSPDTALRDIQDLMQKKILAKEKAGGRSTNYELKR